MRPYRVNLDQLMQLYAANYLMMVRIFPHDIAVGESLLLSPVKGKPYRLRCKEQTKYTSLFAITQAEAGKWQFLQAQLEVRLYHDARLAEVCASQQISRLEPRYDYPNKKMHQKNEKHQVNQFLNDWLNYCLKQRIKVEKEVDTSR